MEVSMVDPEIVSTWTEEDAHFPVATFRLDTCGSQAGIRGSFSGRHFPARHAAVKLEFEGHFPGTTVRRPYYDKDRKVSKKIGSLSDTRLSGQKATRGAAGKRFQLAVPAAIFRPEYRY